MKFYLLDIINFFALFLLSIHYTKCFLIIGRKPNSYPLCKLNVICSLLSNELIFTFAVVVEAIFPDVKLNCKLIINKYL